MANRMRDPIFATSVEVRRVLNEPVMLTKMRMGLEQPTPLGPAIDELSQAVPAVSDISPYRNIVCPAAMALGSVYAALSQDELRALIVMTLDIPPYFREKNNCLYACSPGNIPPGFDSWTSLIGHVDNAISKLALMHRAAARGEPSGMLPAQSRLVRVAWIPIEIWDQHFRVGNGVIFRAPLSTSSGATEPNWEFLKTPVEFQGRHVPCLLEFDAIASRRAAQLGDPRHPISVFGTSEDEWLLPRGQRCYVYAIGPHESGRTSSTGQIVQHVLLKGRRAIAPAPLVLDREAVPTARLLQGAMLVGVGATEALRRGAEAPAATGTVDRLITALERLFGSLAGALEPVNPESLTVAARWSVAARWCVGESIENGLRLAVGMPCMAIGAVVAGATLDKVNQRAALETAEARAAARAQRKEAVTKQREQAEALMQKLQLETVTAQDLAAAADATSFRMERLLPQLRVLLAGLATCSTQNDQWASALVLAEYASSLLNADPRLLGVFRPPNELEGLRARGFFDMLEEVGDTLFDHAPAHGDRAWCAKHACAWEDVLRIKLATSRVLAFMGEPDAGKTTVLEEVFGIKTNGGAGLAERFRTKEVTFYRHPDFEAETCSAYVVDCPGFGDAVHERNDTVRVVSHIAVGLPGTTAVAWITPAKRALDAVTDDLFRLLLPLCAAIIVTHVDGCLEPLMEEMERLLEDEGFDFDAEGAEDALREMRAEKMQKVKGEVEDHLVELCGGVRANCPPIIYAVLAQKSWACSEPWRGSRRFPRNGCPLTWPSAKEDLTQVFNIRSASEIRSFLDVRLGIS